MAIDKNNVLNASWNNESLLLIRTALQELLKDLRDNVDDAAGGMPTDINLSVEGTVLTATVTLADGETELSKSINLATMGFLTQHQSLKTVNGKSITGSGDVDVVHPVVIYNTTPMQFDDTLPIGTVYFDGALHRMTATTPESLGSPRKDVIYFSQQDSAFFRWNDAWVKVMEMPDISYLTNLISSKANASEVYSKSETYNKTETDTALGNKVDTVALNGNVLSYTKHGQSTNVATFKTINGQDIIGDGSISIPAGTTPHIDAVSGNWFIGTVDTHVHAQGAKGDSGVASGDGVRVVNDLNGDPVDLQQGQVAVLSANMGKELSMGILAGKGNFAAAYDCAMENPTTVFPWMLIDEDFDGNKIRKMIWHVGNGVLIDAIGAEMNGARNGYVTIRSNAAGSIQINGLGIQDEVDASLPIIDGEVNYSFAQIADIIKTANNSSAEYDGSSFGIRGITGDATQLDIDFGWADIKSFVSAVAVKCKVIRKMTNNGHFGTSWLEGTSPILREIQMAGKFTLANAPAGSSMHKFLTGCNYLEKADLSGMEFSDSGSASFQGFLGSSSTQYAYALNYVDIRGLSGAYIKYWGGLSARANLKTLIIGNLSSASDPTGTFLNYVNTSNSDITLVCTSPTPPSLKNYDYVAGKFTHIKVPSDALSYYQSNVNNEGDKVGDTGWSKYRGIMSTYEEGEY